MNQQEIRNLERELWDTADELRSKSKLTAAEYKDPLLGLVLLRFAQNRYEDVNAEIDKNIPINPRTGQKREATKDDYAGAGAIMLPEKAKYDYLVNLPESEDIAAAINNAMNLIEEEYTDLAGILPKNYQEFDKPLLQNLVRSFNTQAVRKAKGDVFGRIYEFFLMKFSMQGAGAQEGGEFFTPPALVNLIVHFIQPNHGIIHDPACGSGGMFVQTAHFIEDYCKAKGEKANINEAITVYGTELKSNNAKLAKMNLAIHGIDGKIIEDNSFYTNPHNLTGKCDFVMANPPFNVDKVDGQHKFVTEDDRLPFGVPLTGKGTVSNGNYLWMQYFYAYLNETGRAGFVMASSATDAGNAEKLIRQQLVESGAVECIVSISNNFFYTRSLPCHVWFFNKGKKASQQDKILMIDARNTFRVVNTTINDFSEGQLANLTSIMNAFRGEEKAVQLAVTQHQAALLDLLYSSREKYDSLITSLQKLMKEEESYTMDWKPLALPNELASIAEAQQWHDFFKEPVPKLSERIQALSDEITRLTEAATKKKTDKKDLAKQLKPLKKELSDWNKPLKVYTAAMGDLLQEIAQRIADWATLQAYFPKGTYQDVEGLCKVVDLEEVKAQDYSLTPGRYVGVSIDIDMSFDYKGRMIEIHSELASLNEEANVLMNQIQSVEL